MVFGGHLLSQDNPLPKQQSNMLKADMAHMLKAGIKHSYERVEWGTCNG
jgi:hypothetical protein